jgi:hypothetical protein
MFKINKHRSNNKDLLPTDAQENCFKRIINPLNVELNPICYLLILLGDLTFMDTCIVSIF